jgi:group II intron reverse transcriptase/maturase
MEAKLAQIAKKAQQDNKLKFTSLIHHVNEANLVECYQELKRNKACGIDGQTVEVYGKNLDANVKQLVERLKSKTYQPKPVKRVYIPKAGKRGKRGLGIPSVEDKLVQIMLKKILERIYEADFLDVSYGFRPKLSCHDAIKALNKEVMSKPVNYIVEVDIKGFFDNVDHEWLQRCLEERIIDKNLILLIKRFLKAGYVEEGRYIDTTVGTPQGGVISPLLANIYLHYVLDLWFEKKVKPISKGHVELIRYCDDFVVCCESEKDAKEFLTKLQARLGKFGLEISKDKTKVLKFGRQVWKQAQKQKGKVETFNFLGFTHYCGKSRRGYFVMGHKTSKENICRKLKETKEWIKKIRSKLKLKEWWPTLKSKLIGHYNYFGVSGNYRCLKQFYNRIFWLVFKWINRRSHKKSMPYDIYCNYLQLNPLPMPRICYALY